MAEVDKDSPRSRLEWLVEELETQREELERLEASIKHLQQRRQELERKLSSLLLPGRQPEVDAASVPVTTPGKRVKMSFSTALDLVVAVLFLWDVLVPLYPGRKPAVRPVPPVPPVRSS